MGDWWTTAPLGISMENHEISSISRVTLSPSRQNYDSLYSSSLLLAKSSHNVLSAFCIEENVPQCILYINQELVSLGLSSMCIATPVDATLNAVPALNAMYELLQAQRRSRRSLEELEMDQLRTSSTLEHLQTGNYRLKVGLEWEGEEEVGECSRENLDQSCEQAREQLTNSIRLQWRRLKNHMEKLDSQVSLAQTQQQSGSEEAVPREVHKEEMQRMRLEVQQCKDFIHTQQQLLQQQLNSSFDDETAALLNDCYTLEEKERLKEEWRLFEEQKRNFERERKNFTEAAIRLGREKKTFEEDRAAWLKNQFLNMTPFADRKRYSLSDSQSALSIRSEPELQQSYTPAKQTKSSNYTAFSTPNSSISVSVPSTTELYRTLRLIPDTRHSKRGSWQESSTIRAENTFGKSKHSVRCRDRIIFSPDKDDDSPS
ncbi:unnamed protein product [Lota lota]